jgi:hypothetical protein
MAWVILVAAGLFETGFAVFLGREQPDYEM